MCLGANAADPTPAQALSAAPLPAVAGPGLEEGVQAVLQLLLALEAGFAAAGDAPLGRFAAVPRRGGVPGWRAPSSPKMLWCHECHGVCPPILIFCMLLLCSFVLVLYYVVSCAREFMEHGTGPTMAWCAAGAREGEEKDLDQG